MPIFHGFMPDGDSFFAFQWANLVTSRISFAANDDFISFGAHLNEPVAGYFFQITRRPCMEIAPLAMAATHSG